MTPSHPKSKPTSKPKSKRKGPAKPAAPPHSPNAVQDEAHAREPVAFPVVGICASAGGLEAFTLLLKELPDDTGMAFVFVQHLHPDYESALAEILSRETPMPVLTACEGLPLHVRTTSM